MKTNVGNTVKVRRIAERIQKRVQRNIYRSRREGGGREGNMGKEGAMEGGLRDGGQGRTCI